MKRIPILICCLLLADITSAQQLFFSRSNYTDTAAIERNIPALARQVLKLYHPKNKKSGYYYYHTMRLQLLVKAYDKVQHLANQAELYLAGDSSLKSFVFPYIVYSEAITSTKDNGHTFETTYQSAFEKTYYSLGVTDREQVAVAFPESLQKTMAILQGDFKNISGRDSLSLQDALFLCTDYGDYKIYLATLATAKRILDKIDNETYIKSDSILVKMPDGGTVSIVMARDRKVTTPQPVVLRYNIYARSNDMYYCKLAVDKGYIGIVANTRGKRLSLDAIEPFEHDAKDAYYIIDWISKQPWCNGKIGMYGGSYLGFSQWSAAKYLHPALKTIVPQVSVGAGIDFPMQNGVYMNYALRWLHYVTDTKFTDESGFEDTAKWNKLFYGWYKKGYSLRSLDTMEGRPDAIFQRWLRHPLYDTYWQRMTPQKQEFAKIDIPILTTTGYWDDDQVGAMYYYKQYQKYNKNPNYYLLIGPYDHSGSQGFPAKVLEGYKIDSVANISIQEVVFEWFDYILKGAKRPEILQGKVNFEVMGENKWRHVVSLDKMQNDTLTLYLGNTQISGKYPLLPSKPQKTAFISQTVDLTDRSVIFKKGDDIEAFAKLVDTTLKPEKEKLFFISEPVRAPYAISGAMALNILASINKKDMDLVLDLYEQTPGGKYIALNEVVQRASLAKDRTKRHLLRPGKIERIYMENTYITSTLLEKGSRIIILLGINKNPAWQINYGTGKDVSNETMKDAAMPLQIKWYNGSCVKIPVLR